MNGEAFSDEFSRYQHEQAELRRIASAKRTVRRWTRSAIVAVAFIGALLLYTYLELK